MSKHYYHYQSILPVLFFGFCSIISGLELNKYGFSWDTFLLLIGSLTFVVLGLITAWRDRNEKEYKIKTRHDLVVEISENEINFPEGYFFKVSPVNKNRKVYAHEITEINTNTYPPSFVRNNKEIIFIRYDQKNDLIKFGEKNSIPIIDRFDIWEQINTPFLDTEFDEEEKQKSIERLEKNGIPPYETERIRKKIKFTMMLTNNFAWEWIYLGLYDYLMWTSFLNKKKYWWAMEIALRNKNNNVA